MIFNYMTDEIPNWLDWAYWFSPIPYAFSSLASNEMLSPRWTNKMVSTSYYAFTCI